MHTREGSVVDNQKSLITAFLLSLVVVSKNLLEILMFQCQSFRSSLKFRFFRFIFL